MFVLNNKLIIYFNGRLLIRTDAFSYIFFLPCSVGWKAFVHSKSRSGIFRAIVSSDTRCANGVNDSIYVGVKIEQERSKGGGV